ncbi:MAG TPA: hypothetical protein VGS78_16185 [Candidatus Sulfotelmatobacter sp.]|nr:hypothetical protein [Candidatus Sulfotelmatobacter sp.]
MRIQRTIFALIGSILLTSCSPRDFLTRRLATDLIAQSAAFKAPQDFVLHTGVVSNAAYAAPEYLVLEHHGWISATTVACSPGLTPPPCWDIILTPAGVDSVRAQVSSDEATKPSISIPVARRELIAVTGISKDGTTADVEFTWKWTPLNEIGAALYSSDIQYKSSVGFRQYDDGWRIAPSVLRPGQSMEDALKNAEPSS